MKLNLLTATAITLAIPLGGCASLGNFGFRSADTQRAENVRIDLSDYFASRLADGRAHLRAGRFASAADAFRQASYHPRTAAEAANGLGIAYDRMGRADLAKVQFEKAVGLAPEEARYNRNLAKFEGKELRVQLAKKAAAETRALAARTPKAEPAAAPAPVRTAKLAPREEAPFVATRAIRPVEIALVGGASASRPVAEKTVMPVIEVAHRTPAPEPEVQTMEEGLTAAQPEQKAKPGPRTVTFAGAAPRAAVRVFDPRAEQPASGVALTRISRGEVRIGRMGGDAPAGTVNVQARTAMLGAPGITVETESVASAFASMPPVAGELSLSDAATAGPKPLALAETWAACTSGC